MNGSPPNAKRSSGQNAVRSGLVLLSYLVTILGLTACQTTPIPATSAACLAFAPIRFSRLKDTPETIVAVKAHNAKWEAMCGIKGVNLGGQ